MAWPIDPAEPRLDVRVPTFHKGGRFGAVPHTRVVVSGSSIEDELDWWNGGAVVQSVAAPADTSPPATAQYDGDVTTGDGVWRVLFEWSLSQGDFGTSVRLNLVREYGGGGSVVFAVTKDPNWEPSVQVAMSLLANTTGLAIGGDAMKIEVAEWAIPSRDFPAAVIAEPP